MHLSCPSTVKEKEDLHTDMESQDMNDDTFCEYRWAILLLCRGELQCKTEEITSLYLFEMHYVVEMLK